ncbi:MAG: 2-isopropylmalate synthase, partial [Abditibacteriota bacterium]|nr:2-isopropylmalate synthase [Abditibacteriota bacterium]
MDDRTGIFILPAKTKGTNSNGARIKFFDTTLRDGEQSPGASMNMAQKTEIALQLEKLGVDVIEAGFPASSPGDFDSVKTIAERVRGASVAALCRANHKDIDKAAAALKDAAKPTIHTFIATSDIHIEKKLRMTRDEVLKRAVDAVAYAKTFTELVEFSAEDASRTDSVFLAEVLEAVIAAGATTVNIPDTVGYALPDEFGSLISGLFENVRNINNATVSVHCHNDLGLAVANSLAATRAGARQIECTVNGIGERAGNASLEELAVALKL